MALFAKILLFLNLLIGGAFVYLAVENWTQRQTVAASLLRHQLLVVGLPLEAGEIPPADAEDPDPAIPFSYVSPAGAVTESVSKAFLDTYFKPSAASKLGGADIVNSQIAEVKRVRQRVMQIINAPDSNKAVAASSYLLPLSYSLEDRTRLSSLIQENKGDELTSLLMAKFDEVENPDATRDESLRRVKLAELLFNLDSEPAWQTRVALVVGLKRYKASIAIQAVRFQQMVEQLQRIIEQDQAEYNLKIRSLEKQAITNTEALMDSEKRKSAMQDQLTKDTEHRNQIKTQVDKLADRLADWKTKVNELLVKQTAAEQKLFDYQRQVGGTLVDLFRLEEELTRREQDRLGGSKP